MTAYRIHCKLGRRQRVFITQKPPIPKTGDLLTLGKDDWEVVRVVKLPGPVALKLTRKSAPRKKK